MEKAQVIRVEPGLAFVILGESGACKSCGAKKICKPGEPGTRLLTVENQLNAQPQDWVMLAEKGYFTLRLAFMQFGLPLFALLLGVFAATWLPVPASWHPEAFQSLIGFLLMLGAGVITYLWSKNKANQGPMFSIIEICT